MTGIELIAKEREEQITKHGRTVDLDCKLNTEGQLSTAAGVLIAHESEASADGLWSAYRDIIPIGWDKGIFQAMFDKPYKDRLIIAGALIAAEIDRLQYPQNPDLAKTKTLKLKI